MKLQGFPLDGAKKKLRSILEFPDKEYAEFVEKQKKAVVDFHLKNNAFYREISGANTFSNWESLPVMKKLDYQRPLAERLSDGYNPKNVYTNKTSGSSGNPMVFAKDKDCHALVWANIIRRFGWYGIDFNHSFQARFYGGPMHFVPRMKLKLKDFLSNRFRISVFDISDDGLAISVEHFRNKKFDYINGYTTSVVQLAKYCQRQNFLLTDICPTLKVCIVTSETLFDEEKTIIEKYIGVPVVNEYGASELDVIAFQNPEEEWLVNGETLFIEILDADDNPLPNGELGRIVVTALYNFAHPFIRYEVGDLGILDEKSTAKKPLLKKLVGRANDFATLPSGKKILGMTFYSITNVVFVDDGNVKEFVVKQTKIDTFEIQYVSLVELDNPRMIAISAAFENYLEPNLHFEFIRKEKLDRSTSGKLKQFVSLI